MHHRIRKYNRMFDAEGTCIPVATAVEVGFINQHNDSRNSYLFENVNSNNSTSPLSLVSRSRGLNNEPPKTEVKRWSSQLKEKITQSFNRAPNIDRANSFLERYGWPLGLREAV